MAKEVRKKAKHCTLFEDGTILVKGVICSYPHLGKPQRGKMKKDDGSPSDPKFSVVGLADKETQDDIKRMCDFRIDEILAERNNGKKLPKDKRFIRDGDDTEKAEDEGKWRITASEREENPPILRDERNRTLTPKDAQRKFYGGCKINILLKPWFQDNDAGKRVNAGLIAVQFVEDGERIGGEERISDEDVDDMFEDHGGDDDSGFEDEKRKPAAKTTKKRRDEDDEDDDL